MNFHKPTWWFRLASALVPGRCREVPESQDPDRVLLRQVALWPRHVYLQQFASGEDPDWCHAHNWPWLLTIGLWGSYTERRWPPAGRPVTEYLRRAPFALFLDRTIRHQVTAPSAGHTSLAFGLGPDYGDRTYYRVGYLGGLQPVNPNALPPTPWQEHVKRQVKRI